MAFGEERVDVTPRESVLQDWRKEEYRLQTEHAVTMKRLELELAKENHAGELALKQLEAKWSSLLKLPVLILKLPLFILLGVAYCISVISKKENPKRFWDLLS